MLEGTSAGRVLGIQADGKFNAYVLNSTIALHGGAGSSPFYGNWLGYFMDNSGITSDGDIVYVTSEQTK